MNSLPAIKLFNTLHRQLETLAPITPGQIKLYCCGPTVYNFQHIGNLRTYLFEDILVRTLVHHGYEVSHVMNITDVGHLVSDADAGEDKMLVAAKREKKSSQEIAEYYTQIFFDDCAKLHINRPSTVCKATEHITEMIKLIQRLEERGFTYVSGGNVYFDISKDEDYGKLAKLKLDTLEAGARIEVDKGKRNPHDFVLWFTKSKFEGQELQWESPWGRGYPGWHIECSAMSIKYLGERFDIHCGGIDHIPVHHTNEIAQSECATGKDWVSIWMHGEFLLNENKDKMAKSSGGFLTIKTLEEKGFDALVYRFFCLSAHYRTQLAFSWEALEGAAQSLTKLKRSVLSIKTEAATHTVPAALNPELTTIRNSFFEAFANDLNAPQAMAKLWAVVNDRKSSAAEKYQLLKEFDSILGLGFEEWKEEVTEISAELQALAEERITARKNKDFARADQIRDELRARGYSVEDSATGPVLRALKN